MEFDLDKSIAVLARTPATLRQLLHELPEEWTHANEGGDSWSPFDIVGHLIHGERKDWMARARSILEHGEERAFEPFDRFAQFEASRGKSLEELLDEFEALRAANLEALAELPVAESLDRSGRHPELGSVTLRQLLATWVVHDLGHIGQIARAMARQYADRVGPWVEHLPVLAPR